MNAHQQSLPQTPIEFWQQAVRQWSNVINLPTACAPQPQKSATAEPFAFSNPMQMMQQYMQFWQSMMPQQQPQTPKLTFDFGSMNPFMEPAMQMMQQWQQMWMKGMGR